MEFKNPYALRDGKIVYIEDLNSSEKGLACNCVCPCCGARMQARLGNIKEHHFAHYKSPDCSGGYETALHLLAKELLAEKIPLLLPPVCSDYNNSNGILIDKNGLTIPTKIEAKRIIPDEVKIEATLEGIRPDAIIAKEGQKLIVEIFVSHAVDEQKLEKIKKLKISTIEIDLSGYKAKILTRAELRDLLTNSCGNKTWIYNRKVETLNKEIKNQINNNSENLSVLYNPPQNYAPGTNVLKNHFTYKINFIHVYDCPKKPRFDGEHCFALTEDCLACQNANGFLRKINDANNSEVLCSMTPPSTYDPSYEQIIDYIEKKVTLVKAKKCDCLETFTRELKRNLFGLKEEYKKLIPYDDIINSKLEEFTEEKTKDLQSQLNKQLSLWIRGIVIADSYKRTLEDNKQQFLANFPIFKEIPNSDFSFSFKKTFDSIWSNHCFIIKNHFSRDFNNLFESVVLKVNRNQYLTFDEWLHACILFLNKINASYVLFQNVEISIVPYFQEYLEELHTN